MKCAMNQCIYTRTHAHTHRLTQFSDELNGCPLKSEVQQINFFKFIFTQQELKLNTRFPNVCLLVLDKWVAKKMVWVFVIWFTLLYACRPFKLMALARLCATREKLFMRYGKKRWTILHDWSDNVKSSNREKKQLSNNANPNETSFNNK